MNPRHDPATRSTGSTGSTDTPGTGTGTDTAGAHDADSTVTAAAPAAPSRAPIGRRGFLLGGAGLVAGIALGVSARPIGSAVGSLFTSGDEASAATATAKDTTRRYVSSTATIPTFTVWKKAGATTAPGLHFAAVEMDFHTGVIYDDSGEPVWIEPDGLDMFDLRVQTYQGEPVLTFWSGTLIDGYGRGKGTILDTSYRTVATVEAGSGVTADLHEFRLTDEGTALITSYPTAQLDLSSVDGPTTGYALGCRVQEIDVATGEVLLDWAAADHIGLDESYVAVGSSGSTRANPWDAFHVNAIDVDTAGAGSGTLLVSARHTHTIYSIDRTTGAVNWRMGGKKSDYEIADDAAFAWQHDVRRLSSTAISVFDNHEKSGSTGTSRGLVLTVDDSSKTVTLGQQYTYDARLGKAMGNVQTLDSGNVVVGWGLASAATEFTADGTAVLDVAFGSASYRSFKNEWTATPAKAPAVAALSNGDGTMTAYATWNGATEVASWRFESGADEAALAGATTVARAGFETSADVPSGAVVRAVALNASGAVIGQSEVTAV